MRTENQTGAATTHGLLSDSIVLEGESRDRFNALLARYLDEHMPRTPTEQALVETMVVALWRQMRIWGLEKAGLDYKIRRQDCNNENYTTRTALAFCALSDESHSLELINRYEARYERHYLRAHRRLLDMQDRRRTPPAAPKLDPEPAPLPNPLPPQAGTPPPTPPEPFSQNTFFERTIPGSL